VRVFGVVVAAAGLLLAGAGATGREPRPDQTGLPAVLAERRIRDADIAFFQKRVARDSTGAIDLVRLGGLRLARYRQTGDELELVSAEAAARQSLGNRSQRNPGAWQLLTAALLGQHRFVEAESAAQALVRQAPDDGTSRAILGEVWLELGRYRGADSLFRPLIAQRFNPAITPRYARWCELRGRAAEARRLIEAAGDLARSRAHMSRDQLAWYELRLGELALRFGALREARKRLDAGLAIVPDDWRLLAARARLALEQGEARAAIVLGDSSLNRHLDPATLATVGDAWQRLGDSSQAEEYFRAMETLTSAPRGGFHRTWYLALLDHGRRVPEILGAVRKDLESRQDIYGWDLLAWSLYRSGRISEARGAIRQALAWNDEDPLLRRHSRAIEEVR